MGNTGQRSLYRARGRWLGGAVLVASILPAITLMVLSLSALTHTAHPELTTQLLHKLGICLLHLLGQLKLEQLCQKG